MDEGQRQSPIPNDMPDEGRSFSRRRAAGEGARPRVARGVGGNGARENDPRRAARERLSRRPTVSREQRATRRTADGRLEPPARPTVAELEQEAKERREAIAGPVRSRLEVVANGGDADRDAAAAAEARRRRMRQRERARSYARVEGEDEAQSFRLSHRSAASEGDAETPDGKPVRPAKSRRQNPIARMANQWFDRVMGGIADGGLSRQEEQYAAHRTSRDFMWNSIGVGAWGMVFPILTMIATQLAGVEQAGMFSMAFVTGSLLMIIANFGVRTYQISDVDEVHSFADYQLNRWITCVLMVIVGMAYCAIRGYDTEMFYLSMGVYLYRMVDGLADVYEGRLQQADKLYLAGISQAIRSVLALVAFAVLLFITRNMVVAAFAMAIAAAASFVVITYPLTLLETPKSRKLSFGSVAALFKNTAPLFLALFLYALIDNMPKFVMEGVLSYDNQLYFNALYFPAMGILIMSQLVYKPLLVRMAGVWQDRSKRRKFDLIMVGILAVILAITGLNLLVMAWIGVPVMSFLYGIDFEPYRGLMLIMLVAGGVTAAIDFLYQTITVMRRQKDVTTLYFVTFGFSLFVPILLVMFTGLPGAILSYLIVMTLLFVLLVWEYFRIRRDLAKHPEATGDAPTPPRS